jgi:pimeloyl-ACP methyl ester carboxylesterase
MLNKIIITLTLSISMNTSASFFPTFDDFPKFPNLPIVGSFNPSLLQKFYNQFTDAKPDYEREDRMIGEIEDAVMDGDVEYLPLSNNREAFSIFMEAETDEVKGGVIILHSRGYHANWDSVIKPVRVGMTTKGWHSLSVQMPVLNKRATYYDYVPIFPYSHERIEAAINFYKELGIDNIVLISHGCGAHMAMSYFDKFGDNNISAYVGIGMGATDYKQKVIKRMPLDIILKPVLDVYGEKDFSGVKRSAPNRKWLMNIANNKQSKQMVIKKADHYYKEKGTADKLVEVIDDWLSGLAK